MAKKKRVVLYVEDEADELEAMKIALEERGYTVMTAESGEKALEMLSSRTPDLIIADLRMAPMNGFDLFQKVKKMPRLAKVPFFFLSAVDDPLAQKYGESLGVDAYLTKPTDAESIDKAIRHRLSR